MKSFSRTHPQALQKQPEIWNPSELGVDWAASTSDTQKKQILSIFAQETKDGTDNKKTGNHSVLHRLGISQVFPTWQPGEVISQSAVTCEDEWTFLESIPESKSLQDFEFNLFEPSLRVQADPEKKAGSILEQARLQAEEIILAAQSEADSILLQAQGEIDEQKKEGYQQGLDKAYGEIQDTLRAARTMVEEVHTWQTELTSQGERILMEMLKEISQKIFGEGAELDTKALQVNLNRIMETAHGLGDLNIFLNPRDAKNLDPSWSEYQMLITGEKVKIIPSGKITRGGCFVKGEMGVVDGRVEVQLNAILKTFDEVDGSVG
jgi:flagellar biosynthesis/type III secretory pathway protein FliH